MFEIYFHFIFLICISSTILNIFNFLDDINWKVKNINKTFVFNFFKREILLLFIIVFFPISLLFYKEINIDI